MLIVLAAAACSRSPSARRRPPGRGRCAVRPRRVPPDAARRRTRPASVAGIDLPRPPGPAGARRVLRAGALRRAGAAAAGARSRVACGALRATHLRPRRRARAARRAWWPPGAAIGAPAAAGVLRLGARRAGERFGYVDPLALLADLPGPAAARDRGPAVAAAAAGGAIGPARRRPPRRAPRPPGGRRRPARRRAAGRRAGVGAAGRAARGARRARGAAVAFVADVLLRHDADLLRQRGAAPRPRVHDDRRRRHGPPPPPARRGRLLPHGHRRARRARRRRGRARRASTPQELADRNAERFKALDAACSTPPTTSSSARPTPSTSRRVQEVLQRVHDNGYVYEGTYEGWYCPRCADFKTENEIDDGNRCPIHHIELDARAGGELLLQALRLPGARSRSSTPSGRTSSCRASATTRRSPSSAAACRTCR